MSARANLDSRPVYQSLHASARGDFSSPSLVLHSCVGRVQNGGRCSCDTCRDRPYERRRVVFGCLLLGLIGGKWPHGSGATVFRSIDAVLMLSRQRGCSGGHAAAGERCVRGALSAAIPTRRAFRRAHGEPGNDSSRASLCGDCPLCGNAGSCVPSAPHPMIDMAAAHRF